jgi:hypothetical protein
MSWGCGGEVLFGYGAGVVLAYGVGGVSLLWRQFWWCFVSMVSGSDSVLLAGIGDVLSAASSSLVSLCWTYSLFFSMEPRL